MKHIKKFESFSFKSNQSKINEEFDLSILQEIWNWLNISHTTNMGTTISRGSSLFAILLPISGILTLIWRAMKANEKDAKLKKEVKDTVVSYVDKEISKDEAAKRLDSIKRKIENPVHASEE